MQNMLILGTTNSGKLKELIPLLAPHGIACQSLEGQSNAVVVEETGTTFAENAALKATLQAQSLREWVLAEDSGLVVPALGGEPGIFSARFSGENASDSSNNKKLLERLSDIHGHQRAAHYSCHAALSNPDGTIVATASDMCSGIIGHTLSGSGGFGYDPLFIVPEYHQTFGELPAAVKSMISHRARAMRRMLPAILYHLEHRH